MMGEPRKYEPQWLRLAEAVGRLGKLGFDKAAAQEWLIRAMQDRLRGDRARYADQNTFRISGYPMRNSRIAKASRLYDWPSEIRAKDVNWKKSTVWGSHPVRIIPVHLLIEVRAKALVPQTNDEPKQQLPPAPAAEIRAEIVAVYDEYEKTDRAPPNIKKLGKVVKDRLRARGFEASANSIQEIGSEQVFRARRRPSGVTLASEQRRRRSK